jgi:hypothetical protein
MTTIFTMNGTKTVEIVGNYEDGKHRDKKVKHPKKEKSKKDEKIDILTTTHKKTSKEDESVGNSTIESSDVESVASKPVSVVKQTPVKKEKAQPVSSSEDSDDDSTESDSSSSSSSSSQSYEDDEISVDTDELVSSDVLYTILKKFFISQNGKNIADILEEINQKLSYMKHRV